MKDSQMKEPLVDVKGALRQRPSDGPWPAGPARLAALENRFAECSLSGSSGEARLAAQRVRVKVSE